MMGKVQFRALADTGDVCECDDYPYPVVVDLAALRVVDHRVPVWFGHKGVVLGYTNRVEARGGRWLASGTIQSRFCNLLGLDREPPIEADEWQVSTGSMKPDVGKPKFVPADEKEVVNGRMMSGPLLIFRNTGLTHLAVVPAGLAAVGESALVLEGTRSWDLFPGSFVPNRSELTACLIADTRGRLDLDHQRSAILSGLELACSQRASEQFVASLNAAEKQKGEADAAWWRRKYEAGKRAEAEAVVKAKNDEWLNRGGDIARRVREACGQR